MRDQQKLSDETKTMCLCMNKINYIPDLFPQLF